MAGLLEEGIRQCHLCQCRAAGRDQVQGLAPSLCTREGHDQILGQSEVVLPRAAPHHDGSNSSDQSAHGVHRPSSCGGREIQPQVLGGRLRRRAADLSALLADGVRGPGRQHLRRLQRPGLRPAGGAEPTTEHGRGASAPRGGRQKRRWWRDRAGPPRCLPWLSWPRRPPASHPVAGCGSRRRRRRGRQGRQRACSRGAHLPALLELWLFGGGLMLDHPARCESLP
mmetsp:Transcript_54546/g.137717  ORF Transcript_54546/g.137717 Transcript_54546/m.137717 type:complete len:226 (-) Transcript_54546:581-1258(-)